MTVFQATPPVPVYINARFLAQSLSGVQRFAVETASAMGRLANSAGAPPPIMLAPPGSVALSGLPLRIVGHLQGQAWEQLELPFHARDGILVNLGNTAPLLGRRQLVVIHDAGIFSQPAAYSWKFRAWYRILHMCLVRGRTRIVTVSQFSRTELVRHLGARESEVEVIVEGADHMRGVAADETIMATHGLVPGRFVLVVGNLAAHKNLPALRQTALALEARGIDLVVTGGLDSGVFASLRDNIPQPARYIGRVTDAALRALYQHAACFVFPSLYEGFGLPAVEAMMCECPVVAADIPALREVCGDAALYCNPADPQDIARKICQMLDDAALRERLRSAMAAHVRRFTWERSAQGLISALSSLAQRPHHRDVAEAA